MQNNVTVLILAGGQGSRLGLIGEVVPKPLMPIYDTVLLESNLKYACNHFEAVLVSTRPEFMGIFQTFIDALKKKFSWAQNIKLISNPSHSKSSLDALLFLKSFVETKYILLMFSDIYFLEDPFSNMPNNIESNLLGLSLLPTYVSKKIGLAKKVDSRVISLKYEIPDNDSNNLEWNGLTVMESRYFDQLDMFLSTKSEAVPEEEFIDSLITNEECFSYFPTPRFINANTNEDLYIISEMRRNNTLNLVQQ